MAGLIGLIKKRTALMNKIAGVGGSSPSASKAPGVKEASFDESTGKMTGVELNTAGFFVAKPGFTLTDRMKQDNQLLHDAIKHGN